jgi:hypothetical protein
VALGAVSSLLALAALLAVGGTVNSMVQPAVGLILGSAVSPRRLSLASGLIQAALAAPPLSAGLLVRFLAQPYGWRAALSVGGALVALSALASAFARDRSRSRKDSGISEPPATGGENASLATPSKAAGGRVLLLWSVGGALGTVGVTATAAFFVSIATRSGFPAATAGLLALCAGALAAIVRVGAGAIADLRPRANLPAVVGMMLSGSGGLAVIAVGLSMGTPATFLVGAVVLVAGLWGWNGLLIASAVRLLPGSPVRSLGALQVGFFSGATAAPLLFGVLSENMGVRETLLVGYELRANSHNRSRSAPSATTATASKASSPVSTPTSGWATRYQAGLFGAPSTEAKTIRRSPSDA